MSIRTRRLRWLVLCVGVAGGCATPRHGGHASTPASGSSSWRGLGVGGEEEGLASYYSDDLAGNPTANGDRYDPGAATCAHRRHPFGTKLMVTVVGTGRTAMCRVNDRGPFVQGRVIDVSRAVAHRLGMVGRGVTRVKVTAAQKAD